MIVYDSLSLNMYVLRSGTLCMGYFSSRKVRVWHPKCVSILRAAKTIALQGCDVTNRAEDKSSYGRTRGFPEEKLLWSDSWARIVSYKGRIRTMRACVCRFSKGNELGREADSFEPCSTR